MGGTIDDELRGHPYFVLPHCHAGAMKSTPRLRLVGAADVDEGKLDALCERYEVPHGYIDYREMIEKECPDFVAIATRPQNHSEITVFAAGHGVRAIYCEKPLCCSMAEADAMLEACTRHSVKFNYGTNRRFMPTYRQMREMIDRGDIGDLQSVTACTSGVAQWSHTHASDMLLFLAQDAGIDLVQGHIQCDEAEFDKNRVTVDPPVHMGYVQFASGVRGYLTVGSGYEFEASGTSGRLRALNDVESLQWRQIQGSHKHFREVPVPEPLRESGTVNAVLDLVRALDDDGDTLGNLPLACRSQEMIIGFVESHRQGGARVTLPLANRELYVGTW